MVFSAGRCCGLPVMEYHPPASSFTTEAICAAPEALREEIARKWEARHDLVCHKDLEALPTASAPSLKVCFVAKQCVCGSQANVQHFHLAFAKTLREYFLPKAALRRSLKTAGFVARFASRGDEDVRWLHIAWIHLSTWVVAVLPLVEDLDHVRRMAAHPYTALAVEKGSEWCFDWAVFKNMNLLLPWTVSFYMLYGDTVRVRERIEPWALIARRVIGPVPFWGGPPPPPRRPPAGPREHRPAEGPRREPDGARRARPGRGRGRGRGRGSDGEVAPELHEVDHVIEDDVAGDEPPELHEVDHVIEDDVAGDEPPDDVVREGAVYRQG